MEKKIAVVLSGCGFKDGAEITESVSTLIGLAQFNASYKVFALDKNVPIVNHISSDPHGERNILEESARICRGEIQSLEELNPDEFDGIIFPGGFGAALHLCNWAENGSQCEVHPKVQSIIESFYEQSKPIGAHCIAPVLLAKVLGSKEISITIGNDPETSAEIKKTGAHHVNCPVDDFVTDRENKIITTPAYMYEADPFQVFTGIQKAVKELIEMA